MHREKYDHLPVIRRGCARTPMGVMAVVFVATVCLDGERICGLLCSNRYSAKPATRKSPRTLPPYWPPHSSLLLMRHLLWQPGHEPFGSHSQCMTFPLSEAGGIRTIRTEFWRAPQTRGAPVRFRHEGKVSSVVFSPEGGLIAWATEQGIHLWDITRNQDVGTIATSGGALPAIAFSPDGRFIASAGFGRNQALCLWDVLTRALVRVFDRNDLARCLAFSPDGKTLASGSFGVGWGHKLRMWDLATGERHTGFFRGLWVDSLAFSPDGTVLAAAKDGGVRLIDLKARKVGQRLKGGRDLRTVAFSSDARTVAAGDYNGNVYLWDIPTRESYPPLKGHKGPVWSVAFSPDGQILVSAGRDGTIRLWELPGGILRAVLRGHVGDVWTVACAPDGTSVASGGSDGTVRVWSITTGETLLILE